MTSAGKGPATPGSTGRSAQRRRTRRTIVDATMSLLAQGIEPSINDIAAAAEVSRRTVYMHYPTLHQLVLDATLGLINVDVDAALRRVGSLDPRRRLSVLIDEVYANMEQSLPLGRRLIELTVADPAAAPGTPRRGHRRIGWIEWALEPLRATLTPRQFQDLVSMLAVVIGWESFIALIDIRGLTPKHAHDLTVRAALALLDDASSRGAAERTKRRRTQS